MREEKRSAVIQDALQYLDEDIIETVRKLRGGVVERTEVCDIQDAAEEKVYNEKYTETESFMEKWNRKFPHWRKWTAIAASICVLIIGAEIWNAVIAGTKNAGNLSDFQQGANPEMESALQNGASGDLEQDDYNTVKDESTVDTDKLKPGDQSPSNSSSSDNQETDYSKEEVSEFVDVSESESKSAINIPAMQVSLKKQEDMASDMVAFFIYDGRCYVHQEYIYDGADCVGDYVGTSNGMIDEWTKEDGYVDYAGSISGKFYEVKGIDSEFMLCMQYSNGIVETFIHNNGIQLSNGADLAEDRLQLKERYIAISFLTDAERDSGQRPQKINEYDKELFDSFIDSYNKGAFQFVKDTELDVNGGNDTNEQIYHLYFTTEEGVVLHFWLLGEGYVAFQGLNQICVQIDKGIYKEVLAVLLED